MTAWILAQTTQPVAMEGVPPWLVYVTVALIPALTAFCLAVVLPMLTKMKELRESAVRAESRASKAEGVAQGQAVAIQSNANQLASVNAQLTDVSGKAGAAMEKASAAMMGTGNGGPTGTGAGYGKNPISPAAPSQTDVSIPQPHQL